MPDVGRLVLNVPMDRAEVDVVLRALAREERDIERKMASAARTDNNGLFFRPSYYARNCARLHSLHCARNALVAAWSTAWDDRDSS